MVLIAPTGEVPQLSPVAVLGLLGAGALALLQESLQEELVPPEHGAGGCRIKQAADVGQSLRLIQPGKNGRELVGRFVGKGFFGL